ncbi:hypothetical protein, partial [Enterobacter hormaechei]|uniref:hypothetical protein n=1 Tax=Enterobacter hormaechei TaxID=158836 RepID=UPI0023E41631
FTVKNSPTVRALVGTQYGLSIQNFQFTNLNLFEPRFKVVKSGLVIHMGILQVQFKQSSKCNFKM